MTTEQQFEACAKLDGWKCFQNTNTLAIYIAKNKFNDNCKERIDLWNHPDCDGDNLPNYNSYDTLIPLILKWCGNNDSKWQRFTECLFYCCRYEESNIPNVVRLLLNETTQQLRSALLRAAGEWKE